MIKILESLELLLHEHLKFLTLINSCFLYNFERKKLPGYFIFTLVNFAKLSGTKNFLKIVDFANITVKSMELSEIALIDESLFFLSLILLLNNDLFNVEIHSLTSSFNLALRATSACSTHFHKPLFKLYPNII